LGPFNSIYSLNDTVEEEDNFEIETRNYFKFGPKVREINRAYE